MSCPSCGRQPNRFINGFLTCEGGHEWPGQMERAGAPHIPAVQPVPITIRGVEYSFTPTAASELRTLLCLVALDNPDVDTILRACGVVLDVGGRRVFPPEE